MADQHPTLRDFFGYLKVYIADPDSRTVTKPVLMHYWIRPFIVVLFAEIFWHFSFRALGL